MGWTQPELEEGAWDEVSRDVLLLLLPGEDEFKKKLFLELLPPLLLTN